MNEMTLLLALGALALTWTTSAQTEPEQESNRVGFKPSLFGPPQWRLLHMNALNLPRHVGKATVKFETYLFATADVLPCLSCREDFGTVLHRVPVRKFLSKGRAGAVALMYVLHSIVSDRLGRKAQPIFVEEELLLREYGGNVAPEDVPLILAELRSDHKKHGLDKMVSNVFKSYKH